MGRVLHASYSGYFPFCISELPADTLTGTGTDRPLGMSLEKAMKFFWVFRSFNISSPNLSLPLSLPVVFEPNIPTDKEELYVCEQLKFFEGGVFDSSEIFGSIVNSSITSVFLFPPELQYKIEIVNNSEERIFYPVIIISAFETSAGPITYVKNSSTFKFNPSDIPVYSLPFFDFGTLDFYTGFQGDGSLSIIFSDSLFHSYSGTWNTLTGERL